jgi:pyruvate/2-oxoglutarate dehydrogenase complex dihydrolipoamide dehydrogenase (E3) component
MSVVFTRSATSSWADARAQSRGRRIACVELIAGKNSRELHVIPNVVYTNPELAGVGLTKISRRA